MDDVKIQGIIDAYEGGDYTGTLSLCEDYMNNNNPDRNALRVVGMYLSTALLNLQPDLSNTEGCKRFQIAAQNVLGLSESWQEYYEVRNFIDEEYEKWAFKAKCKTLKKFISNPTSENMDEVIHLDVKYLLFNGPIDISLLGKKNELEEKEGLDINSASAKYKKKTHDYSKDFDIERYKAGCTIFEKAKDRCEEAHTGSAEYLKTFVNSNLREFSYALIAVGYGIPTEEDENKYEDKEELVVRLKKQAEIIDYEMRTEWIINGKPMSVLGVDSQRSENIEKLHSIYARISRLEPGFEVPEDPPRYAIGYSSSTSSSSNTQSGGCYVATAVYGSYDCPEVWTLRRYRDNFLAETWYGRAFIHIYYAISPTLVKWFGDTRWFRNLWKPKIDRMVTELQAEGVESTPYEDKIW